IETETVKAPVSTAPTIAKATSAHNSDWVVANCRALRWAPTGEGHNTSEVLEFIYSRKLPSYNNIRCRSGYAISCLSQLFNHPLNILGRCRTFCNRSRKCAGRNCCKNSGNNSVYKHSLCSSMVISPTMGRCRTKEKIIFYYT